MEDGILLVCEILKSEIWILDKFSMFLSKGRLRLITLLVVEPVQNPRELALIAYGGRNNQKRTKVRPD